MGKSARRKTPSRESESPFPRAERHGELPIVQPSCEASRSSAPTFPRSKSYSLLFSPPSSLSSTLALVFALFFPSPPSLTQHYLSFSHHVRPAGFDCNFSRVNARRKKKAGLKKRIETLAPFFFFSNTDGGDREMLQRNVAYEMIGLRAFAPSSSVDFRRTKTFIFVSSGYEMFERRHSLSFSGDDKWTAKWRMSFPFFFLQRQRINPFSARW